MAKISIILSTLFKNFHFDGAAINLARYSKVNQQIQTTSMPYKYLFSQSNSLFCMRGCMVVTSDGGLSGHISNTFIVFMVSAMQEIMTKPTETRATA